MKDFIKKTFCEDNGNPSFIRIATGFSVFVFTLSTTYAYIHVVHTPDLKEMIDPMTGIILGYVEAALGIKYLQKKSEQDVPVST